MARGSHPFLASMQRVPCFCKLLYNMAALHLLTEHFTKNERGEKDKLDQVVFCWIHTVPESEHSVFL